LVVGVGIDIVDLEEFRSGLTKALIGEFYLPDEISYVSTQVRPWESYGARLAAKRALLRALGEDVGSDVRMSDIEVVRGESGELDLRLTGAVLEASRKAGADAWHVSVSHTRGTALAVVVLIGAGAGREADKESEPA
jgi:holo-[acyl-carrier protein] synthase